MRPVLPFLLVATLVADAGAADDFVYVHDAGADQVHAYALSADGVLTALAGSPFDGPETAADFCGSYCQSMAYARLGKEHFLFTADETGVTVWTIAADGTLTVVPGSPFDDGIGAGDFTSVTAVRSGSRVFIYTTAYTADRVVGFSLQKGGALVSVPGSPYMATDGPTGIDGAKRLLVATMFLDDQVRSYIIQKDGGLVEAPASPMATAAMFPYNVELDLQAKTAYVGGANQDLHAFAVDKSGDLTALAGSPYTAATAGSINGTRMVGKKVMLGFGRSAAAGEPTVSVSMRAKDGAPTVVGLHATGLPGVTAHAVDAKGRRLILVSDDESADNVLSYRMDPKTGMTILADGHQVTLTQVNDVEIVRR